MAWSVDQVVSQQANGGDRTVSVTVTSSDQVLVAIATAQDSNTNNLFCNSIVRNSQSFTKQVEYGGSGGAGQPCRISIWTLVDPSVGTYDATGDFSIGINNCSLTVMAVSGANPYSLINGTPTGSTANGTPGALSVTTTVDNCLMVGGIVSESEISGYGTGQTERANLDEQSYENTNVSTEELGVAGAFEHSYSLSAGGPYAQACLALSPEVAFSPTLITGLKVWLKADALALSNNDPVTTWTDSSGNSNSPTQAVAGAKPTYKTNIFSTQPAISFDGGDGLSITGMTNTVSIDSSCTIFALISHTQTSTGLWKYIQQLRGGAHHIILTAPHGNTGGAEELWIDASGTTAERFSGINDGDPHIVCIVKSSTTITPYLDGTSGATVTATVSVAADELYIGVNQSGGENFNGYIAEYIAYNSALSTTDRTNVQDYLNTKYGISTSQGVVGTSFSDLEYAAYAVQTGLTGKTLNEQKLAYYIGALGVQYTNVSEAEVAFLKSKTSKWTETSIADLWHSYFTVRGVPNYPSLYDRAVYFFLNVGFE